MSAATPARHTLRSPRGRRSSGSSAPPSGGETAASTLTISALNGWTSVAGSIVTDGLVQTGSAWRSRPRLSSNVCGKGLSEAPNRFGASRRLIRYNRQTRSRTMTSPVKPILFFLTVLAVGTTLAIAQSNGGTGKPTTPFIDGETLTYEGKISKIIRGIAVADLTLTLRKAQDGEDYIVKAEARSKGTLLKLFRFSFLQEMESSIDSEGFRTVRTVKHDVQKERVRDSEAIFDYGERRVTYVETDPNEPMRPPRRIASKINDISHDLISSIYSVRMMPLAVGKVFRMSVSDSGLVFDIPVRVTGREIQKTIFGKQWCFRIEPEIFGTGRMIEREGSMVIWITDDARRLPVRSLINSPYGKIDVRLKSAKNLR